MLQENTTFLSVSVCLCVALRAVAMYLEEGELSREMGHSSVQVTKLYLEDFTSTEARKEHTSFSPNTHLNL